MARRARRPRNGGSDPEPAPFTPVDYLAAELLGNNPRVGLNDRGAVLKVEVAANTKTFYRQRGERRALAGTLGAALVLEDPNETLDFDENGRLRIRVFSADELEAFGWRLIRFAQTLRIANAVGASYADLRAAYWGDDTGAARDTRRTRRGRRARDDEEDEGDDELVEDEVR